MKARVLHIKVEIEGEPNYGDWLWDLEQEICDELKSKGFQIVSYLCEEKEGR